MGIYHCLSTPTPSSPTLPALMYMRSKMVQMWEIWYKVGLSDCLVAPYPFPHSPDPYIQIGTKVGNLIQGGISDCLATPPPFSSNFPTLPTLTNRNGTNVGNLIQGKTISFSTHHFPGFPPPPLTLQTLIYMYMQSLCVTYCKVNLTSSHDIV